MSLHEADARTESERLLFHGWAAGRLESLDAATLAFVRCVIAGAILSVLWIEPSDLLHSRLTYFSGSAYLVYAIGVTVLSRVKRWQSPPRWLHWVDVAFTSYLIALTGGSQSIFFFCFFFPVMVAAFCHGSREGLLVAAAAMLSFLSLGLYATAWSDGVDLRLVLIRPFYLLMFGYLVAYWGGLELELKRQLYLLQSLNALRNPRFGVEFTAKEALRRLREHYAAAHCALLTSANAAQAMRCHVSSSQPEEEARLARELSGAASLLVDAGAAQYVLRFSAADDATGRGGRSFVWDRERGLRRSTEATQRACSAMASALRCASFLSVPYAQHDGTRGCVIVAGGGLFSRTDAVFLAHYSGVLAIVTQNTQLIEELISGASERERSKLALDIHDATIQPYVGLRMGLQALYREADEDSGLRARMRELMDMADLTIGDLRQFTAELRRAGGADRQRLEDAVKEQAERYARFYGVEVAVEIQGGSPLGNVATDIFHIVMEGLSNIRKHTSATRAYVRVVRDAISVRIRIANEAGAGAPAPFRPRSIERRVQSLGGSVRVGLENGYTLVDVNVPI
jgi:signal transduction histidine kinase